MDMDPCHVHDNPNCPNPQSFLNRVQQEEGGGSNDGQHNDVSFHLCVRRFNEQAIGFYQSLGFVSDNSPSAVAQHGLDPMKYTAMKQVVRDREM